MKRESLTKCLQLAHDLNDQEVINLISSKYRVAKVIVAQINVPPVPGRESWALYQYNNFSSRMGGGPINLVEWYMKTFPASPLISEGSLLEKLEDKVRHVELWLEYEADLADKDVFTRRNAAETYANKYKTEIDPKWEVGTSEVGKDKVIPGYYIHDYIKEMMKNWYISLYPNDQKKIKGTPSLDFDKWWYNLPHEYSGDTNVVNALNASFTIYYEPKSGSYACTRRQKNIKTSEEAQKDNPYIRMLKVTDSLHNFGIVLNKFPYSELEMKYKGDDVTFYNPDKQKLNDLINNLQRALVGDTKEKKKQEELDLTGPLNLMTNLMTYKGGKI
jgi:hypothetical protein